MSWSARRKLVIFLIVIVALAIIVGVPSFFLFYHAPTCFDGIQNQGEQGIDCGGPCAKLCQEGFVPPQELWATSSQVVSGIYNLLAYAANPNVNVSASNVPYDFKVYDSNGILISERAGQINIPDETNFAIFEPSITTGNRVPYRTFFEFTASPLWQAAATSSPLSVVSSDFTVASTTSLLDTSVLNSSLVSDNSIDVIAILYGTDGNVIAFSKSFIQSIAPNTAADVSFTWPYPISALIAKKEFLFNDNLSQ